MLHCFSQILAVLPVPCLAFVIDQSGVVPAMFRPDQLGVTEQSLSAAVLPLLPRQATR